jgi:hypothetical protein
MAPFRRPLGGSTQVVPAGGGGGGGGDEGQGKAWTKSVWKSAGQRVAQSNQETRKNLAAVVGAAAVQSSANAARRLLSAARDSHKKALAAKGSRNVVFSSGYVYFLVLAGLNKLNAFDPELLYNS